MDMLKVASLSVTLPLSKTIHGTDIGLPIRPGVLPGGVNIFHAVPWMVWDTVLGSMSEPRPSG